MIHFDNDLQRSIINSITIFQHPYVEKTKSRTNCEFLSQKPLGILSKEMVGLHPRGTNSGGFNTRDTRHYWNPRVLRLRAGREELIRHGQRKIRPYRHFRGIGSHEQFPKILRHSSFLSGALGCTRLRGRVAHRPFGRFLESVGYELFLRKPRLREAQNECGKIQSSRKISRFRRPFRFRGIRLRSL